MEPRSLERGEALVQKADGFKVAVLQWSRAR